MAFKPTDSVEEAIFDVWKRLAPSGAFIAGLNEYAGQILVPDTTRLEDLTHRIDEVSSRAESRTQERLLASLKAQLRLILRGEAQIPPDTAIEASFSHLIKEGIVAKHLASLAEHATSALTAYASSGSDKSHPAGIRILTSIRCSGVVEVAETIRKQTRSKRLVSALDTLIHGTQEYQKLFGIAGFKNSGFDEIVEVCSREGCELGRSEYYADALADLYDYSETPSELEAKGLEMLNRELPGFRQEIGEQASKFGVAHSAEAVAHAISKRKALPPSRVIGYLRGVKRHVTELIDANVVRINPRYRTRVVETPTFLSAVFPSGGAMFLDFLAKKPFQIFLATTDPRRSPETSPAELLNLLVHEEYGHCVHSSNSAVSFGARPTLIDMLQSHAGGAVSEGISFHRESEFLSYLEEMRKRTPRRTERAFLRFLDKYGGAEELLDEYGFFTHLWRITRFLRVVGDARINSGKQSLMDFVDWANRETGLSKSLVYHQVFPAHQGIGPGYASTYAIVGESIASIQKEALRNGKTLRDFNTYACSLGFPPRSVFEEKLRTFASS